MSSVFTPRSWSTRYSSPPKSSPTGPTTRTSVKKLAASEKWTAEPPSIRSRSPKGDLTASKAIDPTTHRLMAAAQASEARRGSVPDRRASRDEEVGAASQNPAMRSELDETLRRELLVAFSTRAQPVWFRLAKWTIFLGVSRRLSGTKWFTRS